MSVTSHFPSASEAVPEHAPVKANPRQEASNDMRECVERVLHTDARVPVSTYRVQMHKDFNFADAQAIVGYLKQLGIGDFYSSPIFEARPGSMHGYDVTRHDRLNPELGGEEGFASFSAELQRQGLGLLLDIVPNHMGVGNDSDLVAGRARERPRFAVFRIFRHRLEAAQSRPCATSFFCPSWAINMAPNWRASISRCRSKTGAPLIHYYDHTMPVAPRTVHLIFDQLDRGPAPAAVFRELLQQIDELPPHETSRRRTARAAAGSGWRSCCPGCGRRCARRKCSRSSSMRSRPSTASKEIPTASTACTFCWMRSRTGWPPGAPPPKRSTTAASSM